MVTFEFGTAEKLHLEANSIYIKFFGEDFRENLQKIKGFWNRVYHGAPNYEWEVPYSCLSDLQELYKDAQIKYLNAPPKAVKVSNDDILDGIDFNGYILYDYQLEGVKYGLDHKNFLLLDEQRIR